MNGKTFNIHMNKFHKLKYHYNPWAHQGEEVCFNNRGWRNKT